MICIIQTRSRSRNPLIPHSVNTALRVKIFNKNTITAVLNYYIKFLKKKLIELNTFYKKIFFFKKTKFSSTDTVPIEIVIDEILGDYKQENHALLIQVISPFLKSKDIVKAFFQFRKKNLDIMFSSHIFKKFLRSKKNLLKPLNYNHFKRPMRQKIDKF